MIGKRCRTMTDEYLPMRNTKRRYDANVSINKVEFVSNWCINLSINKSIHDHISIVDYSLSDISTYLNRFHICVICDICQ